MPATYTTLRALDDASDLDRFLDLRRERDRIDAELAALSPVILAALQAEDGGRLDVAGFTLEACTRPAYAYSPEVVETEAYLKDLRAAERKSGTARRTSATEYVRVSVDRAQRDAAAVATIERAEAALATPAPAAPARVELASA